jgi:hypothetical protein
MVFESFYLIPNSQPLLNWLNSVVESWAENLDGIHTSSSGCIWKVTENLADNQRPATFRRSWNFDH